MIRPSRVEGGVFLVRSDDGTKATAGWFGDEADEWWWSADRCGLANHRKTMQLCRQVGETLDRAPWRALTTIFCGTCRSSRWCLAPDTSRMLVTLRPVAGVVDPVRAIERLSALAGELRTEVASAITRRKCPSLMFQIQQGGSHRIVGAFHQALGDPPEVAVGVADAALTVAVGHVLHGHDLGGTCLDGACDRVVGIFDVEVVRRGHGWVVLDCFADHDGRGAEADLGIGDAIAVHVAADFGAAEAGDQELDEVGRAVDEEVRSDGVEAGRDQRGGFSSGGVGGRKPRIRVS